MFGCGKTILGILFSDFEILQNEPRRLEFRKFLTEKIGGIYLPEIQTSIYTIEIRYADVLLAEATALKSWSATSYCSRLPTI